MSVIICFESHANVKVARTAKELPRELFHSLNLCTAHLARWLVLALSHLILASNPKKVIPTARTECVPVFQPVLSLQRVMKVPEDKEAFSSDSEPESRVAVKSPQKREKSPSPVDASTPKQEQREEKMPRREPAPLAQIRRKPSDLTEKAGPREDERKK